jgi:nucleoside-diphosphate-sugar epimerase
LTTSGAPILSRPVCLITGATGALGPGVVNALGSTFEIRTFSRHSPDVTLFRVPIAPFVGDIDDGDQLRRAAAGADVIVHLAALLHVVNPPTAARAEYERVNVRGTGAVIDAANRGGVSRLVFMSTIAVYGHQKGMLLDEDSRARPDTFYAETKLSAERLVLEARRPDGRALSTVIRSAAVYGPRVKGNYWRLVRALANGRFVPIGRGDNLRTLVFEDDLAAAIALAATHPDALGRTYNVSDGEPHSLREIVAAICGALGRRPPRWHAPVAPVRLALRAASVIDRRLPSMLDKYLEEVAVDGSRIRRELGFRPRTGLIEGWNVTIAEMKRTGVI